MAPEFAITRPQNLNLYTPDQSNFGQLPAPPKSPNEWFVQRYPEAYENHGSPFLDVVGPDKFTAQILPTAINYDFFAAMLGGRSDLGHHVIYFEPEMQWYFRDADQIYKTTSIEKLMVQYRALMLKCAEAMPPNVHKLNLFQEWRSERVCKVIVQRAKSILSADHTFFSPQFHNQRIRGPELHERLARKFVDELLTASPGNTLLLADAYVTFLKLVKEQNLEPMNRSMFKAMIAPAVQEKFAVCLRNDLKIDERQGVRGWKNVGMVQTMPG